MQQVNLMLNHLDMEYTPSATTDTRIGVSKNLFEGKQFEIDTFMPIIQVMHAEDDWI